MHTEESRPVPVDEGDDVVGGTVAVSGRLRSRATAVGEQTRLAEMSRMVAEAQSGKSDAQRLADRVSSVFVPIVLLLSLATFVAWWVLGEGSVTQAANPALAVLIIACPCALGLATPTALMVASGRGAQLGIFIKGPHALEATRSIDTVVFDKTGTITEGALTVGSVESDDDAARRAGLGDTSGAGRGAGGGRRRSTQGGAPRGGGGGERLRAPRRPRDRAARGRSRRRRTRRRRLRERRRPRRPRPCGRSRGPGRAPAGDGGLGGRGAGGRAGRGRRT